jgi:hypothetical protein
MFFTAAPQVTAVCFQEYFFLSIKISNHLPQVLLLSLSLLPGCFSSPFKTRERERKKKEEVTFFRRERERRRGKGDMVWTLGTGSKS